MSFNVGDKIYYMALNKVCYSKITKKYTIDNQTLYDDNQFKGIKEIYIFKKKSDLLKNKSGAK